MTNQGLDERIDQLAREIEQTIKRGKNLLNELPDFAPRSDRSKKVGEIVENENE